ncbi:hypothetical protein LJC74_05390 [Eubacteriales bacterium OttesenSCG-928-A19]|nr:hypothetical protein [Eubacteriales bacterium OttesenSCG-928-A19]
MELTYEDLRICHSLVREANDLRERIERLRSMAEWCTSQINPSGGYGGHAAQDRVGSLSAELADMEQEAQRRIQAFVEHARVVDAGISQVEDSTQRTVLRLRYLDGLSWEEISGRTHYHTRWCKELHRRGLGNMRLESTQHTKAH